MTTADPSQSIVAGVKPLGGHSRRMLRLFADNTRGRGTLRRGTGLQTESKRQNFAGAPKGTAGRGFVARRAPALAACAAASLALAGCGMSSLTSGLGGGMFGGGGGSPSASNASVSEDQLLAAAKINDPASTGSTAAMGEVSSGCPRFIIAPRDNNITFYEAGRSGDGLAIIHRGEITKTARECYVEPGRVTVKYGFSGRVLLGPKGHPGPVSLPVNIVVNDSKRAKVAGDSVKVDVDVGADRPIGYFSAVRSVTFDIPEGSRAGEFELVVGFDNKVAGAG